MRSSSLGWKDQAEHCSYPPSARSVTPESPFQMLKMPSAFGMHLHLHYTLITLCMCCAMLQRRAGERGVLDPVSAFGDIDLHTCCVTVVGTQVRPRLAARLVEHFQCMHAQKVATVCVEQSEGKIVCSPRTCRDRPCCTCITYQHPDNACC